MVKIQELRKKFLPKGGFAHSVSLLAGGTALAQVFAVLAAPFLTRVYRAEDFGYYQMYMSVMMFATVLVTLRFEQAIFLPDNDNAAADVFFVALGSVCAISAVSACLVWLIAYHWVLPKNADGLRRYLWLIPLAMCGAGVYQCLSTWALRQKGYSRVSGTKVTQVGSQLAAQILIGVVRSGPLGLLVGDAIGRFTGSLNLARFAWRRSSNLFRAIRWKGFWGAVVRYRRFPLVSSPSALIGVAAAALPPLLIAQLYGARTLGWFALGDRVLGAPSMLVGQAISQVYSVDAAAFNGSDPAKLKALFLKSAKHLAIVGIVPFSLFVAFAPVVFSVVFGRQWREAGEYARILALMHYLAFIAWPLAPTLNLLEQQIWQFAWDSGRLILTLGSLWIVYFLGGSARMAIGIFGLTMLIGYVSHFALSYLAIRLRTRGHKAAATFVAVPPPYVEA